MNRQTSHKVAAPLVCISIVLEQTDSVVQHSIWECESSIVIHNWKIFNPWDSLSYQSNWCRTCRVPSVVKIAFKNTIYDKIIVEKTNWALISYAQNRVLLPCNCLFKACHVIMNYFLQGVASSPVEKDVQEVWPFHYYLTLNVIIFSLNIQNKT